jgi:hypothetical protein
VAEAGTSRVAVAADAKTVRQSRVVVAAQPKGAAQAAAAAAAPQPNNNLEQEMASLLNKPGKT